MIEQLIGMLQLLYMKSFQLLKMQTINLAKQGN